MSKTEAATTHEDTFATKLGIEMVSIKTYEALVEKAAGTRLVVTAVGASGLGKTAVPKQVAKRRNGGKGVPYVALHMPTMSLEDFHVPTFSPDTKLYYDRRVSRRFEVLFDWIEDVKKKNKGKVPPDLSPILAFEELNRAVDKSVTRAAFTMLDDRVIGDATLDDGIQFVVTMNPSGGGMSVNEFEKDPAMRRRLTPMIGVTYHYGDFMGFATTAKFHPSVLQHLGAQPSHGYDEQAANSGKAFACPATWEAVSRICRLYDDLGESVLTPSGRAAISGAIGTGSATAFLDFVRDHTLLVTPEDVLTTYGPDSEARRRFKSYLTDEGGRFDKVTELATGLAVRIFADIKRSHESIVPQLAHFMSDLPTEVMMAFSQKLVEEAGHIGTEAKSYLQVLNQKLAAHPAFNEAVKKLHHAKRLGSAEAQSKS